MLFIPIIVLVAALVVLATNNLLGRGFRSNWLLATAGALLSWLTLLFLRLRLPLSLDFSSWWVGQGLVQSTSFVIDELSWPFAFALSSLLVIGLFFEVRHSVDAPWHSWLPPLAITALAILATLSGDLLAFAFSLTLIDSLVFAMQIANFSEPDKRRAALAVYFVNLIAVLCLVAAWALSTAWPVTANLVILMAAALRLQIFTQEYGARVSSTARLDISLLLRTGSLIGTLLLLTRGISLGQNLIAPALLTLLLPTAHASYKCFTSADNSDAAYYWALGFSFVALSASLTGNPPAVMALGIMAVFGSALIVFSQQDARLRPVISGVGLIAFSSLPFTPSAAVSTMYTTPSSFLHYAFIPLQGLLVAGWARRRNTPGAEISSAEPWVRGFQTMGFYALPAIFLLYGVGLAPTLTPAGFRNAIWPGLVIILFAGLASLVRLRAIRCFPQKVDDAVLKAASFSWIEGVFGRLFEGGDWFLRAVSRILEGQAGVLWAVLLIALLLSLVAQYALQG